MDRINISIENGELIVSYPFNLFKNTALKPVRLFFDSENKRFKAPVSKLNLLVNTIRENGLYMKLSEECQEIIGTNSSGLTKEDIDKEKSKWINHPSFADNVCEDFDMSPFRLKDSVVPYGYQKAGMKYAVDKGGRAIIGDDMGLGKTLQSIAVASYYYKSWPLVIVVPASLLYNWRRELLTFLSWIQDDDINIMDETSAKPKGLITICSYHYASQNIEALREYLNVQGFVIVDEAHSIKNHQSIRGESIIELAHHAKRCILITGTPILNAPKEFYSLLYSIDPIDWGDYTSYTERYCEGHWSKIKNKSFWYDSGASNLNELMTRAREGYMVRRLKKDVLKQLPKKRRYPVTLNSTSNDKELDSFTEKLTEISSPILEKNNYDVSLSMPEIRSELNNNNFDDDVIFKAYENAGLYKIDQAINWVEDLISAYPDEKLIFFVHNQSVLNKLTESFGKKYKKESYIIIDGSIDKKKRFDLCDDFQEKEDCKYAFLTIGAASVGLTLTKSSKVIMLQMPWTPGISMQAEDRAHRIGQLDDVDIIYLLGNNGFDFYLWRMLESKSFSATSALDGVMGENFEATEDDSEFTSGDLILGLVSYISEDIQKNKAKI